MNNLFKGLLFLEGHVVDPHLFDDFAPHYGNQRASQRRFGTGFAQAERTQGAQVAAPTAQACSG